MVGAHVTGLGKAIGGKVLGGGVAILKGGMSLVVASDAATARPRRNEAPVDALSVEDVTAFASVFIDDDEAESVDLQTVRGAWTLLHCARVHAAPAACCCSDGRLTRRDVGGRHHVA